ncbi:MAG: hypothetical protein NXI16_08920 [Alphaproteobacteria bacterium]|nr:hypothetical protein [Alphaproteobacteria bacterium]
MTKEPMLTHDYVAKRLETALRLYMPDAARARSVENATGVPCRTLKSYREGNTPGLANFLAMCKALGPGFTSDILSMVGQSAHAIDGEADADAERLTDLLTHAAAMSKAMEDGRIDHREFRELAPMARALGADLIAFSARIERA